jgi:hypothetical protein
MGISECQAKFIFHVTKSSCGMYHLLVSHRFTPFRPSVHPYVTQASRLLNCERDSLKTDRDISFTLGKRDGHPVIENLKGISVDTDILGIHLNAPITELAVHLARKLSS